MAADHCSREVTEVPCAMQVYPASIWGLKVHERAVLLGASVAKGGAIPVGIRPEEVLLVRREARRALSAAGSLAANLADLACAAARARGRYAAMQRLYALRTEKPR